ncbi:hypothetical protein DFP73DRAFT_561193 [Morchella snyderi]|nr:hypothetical protein DFP73DRAFT_561193 [Morchella snyderi]
MRGCLSLLRVIGGWCCLSNLFWGTANCEELYVRRCRHWSDLGACHKRPLLLPSFPLRFAAFLLFATRRVIANC